MKKQRKPRILVLEDAAEVRELLTLQLRRAGYEVFAAEDAIVAGRLVLDELPDLIIADIQLPYMNGDEFVAALRGDPATRAIPVIFLSVDERVDEHAKNLGAVAYFRKGVSAESLLEVVAFYAGV